MQYSCVFTHNGDITNKIKNCYAHTNRHRQTHTHIDDIDFVEGIDVNWSQKSDYNDANWDQKSPKWCKLWLEFTEN